MTLQRVSPKVVPGEPGFAVLQGRAVVGQHGVARVVEAQRQLGDAHVVLDVQGAQKDVFMWVHLPEKHMQTCVVHHHHATRGFNTDTTYFI